jgi:hypothetical protein
MKRVLLYLVLGLVLLVPLGAAGCSVVTGSGETATWEMDYSDFNKVEIGSAFDVQINRAESFLVRITIDKKLYEYLKIEQRGDTLHIGLKTNYVYRDTTQQATVNLPDLRRLELSGAAKATVTGFIMTHSLDFELSGASQLELGHTIAGNSGFSLSGDSQVNGSIEMDDGRFDLSGASRVNLSGTAKDISIDASGASNVNLGELAVLTVDVNLSGASYAVINVVNSMSIDLSGASNLEYIGNPKLGKIDMSGGSTLNKRS